MVADMWDSENLMIQLHSSNLPVQFEMGLGPLGTSCSPASNSLEEEEEEEDTDDDDLCELGLFPAGWKFMLDDEEWAGTRVWVAESLEEGTDDGLNVESVVVEYCTRTRKVKIRARQPRKGFWDLKEVSETDEDLNVAMQKWSGNRNRNHPPKIPQDINIHEPLQHPATRAS